MNKTLTKADIGSFGEKQCVKYLKKNGFRILDKNARIGHLEADIIAYNKTHLIFVEVKTRRTDMNNILRPAAAVDKNKKSNLISFAKAYVKTLSAKFIDKQISIDVCEITVYQDKGKLKIDSLNYINNAVSR